ncbi:unnamed protein product [Protopolystoma xenopodis]|uniref:PPM-type phosphatase domain-containing protein n=1 Tax=Protopolystoma xenopodis TaxID=117903 RepID=A0A448WRT1_9PLAT|nr:unnamed protein product [Protopolystoma xenopodis]
MTIPHQCATNASEVARITNEHPMDAPSQLFREGGRLCGELAPCRAFGDVRYKWSADQLLALVRHLAGDQLSGQPNSPSSLVGASGVLLNGPWAGLPPLPRPYTSPPYLTAEPEITKIEAIAATVFVLLKRYILHCLKPFIGRMH